MKKFPEGKQIDMNQIYKALQLNSPLSAKVQHQIDLNQRTASQNKQVAQKVTTQRVEPNLITKEFLRLHIREKEHQQDKQQKNTLMKKKSQSQSFSQQELAIAMQKYQQYMQQSKELNKVKCESYHDDGSRCLIQSKINNNNTLMQSKSQGNLLNQFVTKVNQGDTMNFKNNLSVKPINLNTINKIKKRSMDQEKPLQLSKPPTPQEKNSIPFDFKNFSSRPQTSDSQRIQVNQAQQLISQARLRESKQVIENLLSQKQRVHSQNNLQCLTTKKQNKQTLLLGVQGYYLHQMQHSFSSQNQEEYFGSLYRDHFFNTYQGVYFAQFLKPVDPSDLKNKKVTLKIKDYYKNKISLVLDLDETLVHCNENLSIPSDITLKIQVNSNDTINAGVNIRPGAIKFLEDLSKDFEIIIFTASHSCYAQKVLEYLDPKNCLIQHRLFRDNCIMTTGGMFTKDLRIFENRPLDQIVLVDNAAYSYAWQVDNGIPIIPYYDNKEDRELELLTRYLKSMVGATDVRQYNRDYLATLWNKHKGTQIDTQYEGGKISQIFNQ